MESKNKLQVANPLSKMLVGSMAYLDRKVANPMSKVLVGAMTYLDRTRKESEELRPSLLSLSINDECNLNCSHCIERDYKRGGDKSDLMKSRLEELPDKSVLWTSIAGKEPTTTPKRLEEIARIARPKSEKVILMTNGVALNENLQKRLNGFVDYIDVSIDGVDSYKTINGKAWKNALTASKNGFEKVSALTTLTRDNYPDVGGLIDRVSDESDRRIAHSIGFYLGCPGDKGMLGEEEMIEAIGEIVKTDRETIVQISPSYSRFLPRIFNEFGVDENSKRYDSKTGIPSFEIGKNSLLIPSSHLETPMNFLRAEVDGNVYFGCSHVMLQGDTSEYAIGNLEKESLKEIQEKIASGKNNFVEKASYVGEKCLDSECFEYCRGGDRLNGVIFTGKASDPYCEKLN